MHFEGLLPRLAGQRFYSQMIDGWVWNIFRGQVVGAGTFAGRPMAETPAADFAAEMARWGVKHLFVWTDEARSYLAEAGFVERWRGGRWSQFERPDADVRQIATLTGIGELRNTDWLGADVVLRDVRAASPSWCARALSGVARVRRRARSAAPESRRPAVLRRAGVWQLHGALEYPRYRGLSILAILALIGGGIALAKWPRSSPVAFATGRLA